MKQRFILYRRNNGKFYCEDAVTKKQSSLKTSDESEAIALLNAKNESFRQPILNMPRDFARTWRWPVVGRRRAHICRKR